MAGRDASDEMKGNDDGEWAGRHKNGDELILEPHTGKLAQLPKVSVKVLLTVVAA